MEGKERDTGVRKMKFEDLKFSLEGRDAGISKAKAMLFKIESVKHKG